MKEQTKLCLKKSVLFLCILASMQARPDTENSSLDDNLVFDESMFRGSNVTPSILEHLSADNSVLPGNYNKVQVIVNGYQVGDNDIVVSESDKKSVICMSNTILAQAGFIKKYIKKFDVLKKNKSCVSLADIAPDARVKLNSDLLLDFNVPQALLKDRNSGAIPESALDRGEPVIFTNYTANYFHNKQTGASSGDSDYLYLNLNGGLNLGLWQYRQLSNYSYSKSSSAGNSTTSSIWNSDQSYFQRPLYLLKSNLKLGKTNTTGQFFGGLMYTGVELSSDESMYPVSEQGYAPVITGIAKSNALIEVRQNNTIIYQTNVSPGPFDIRNISPTSYNGDLNVTVTEADGSKNSFVVPSSAVPDSVRAGKIKYTFSSGKTRDLVVNKTFMDTGLQYGLNNGLALGGGVRAANNYTASNISSVFSTRYGA
ncbi:fimbria/pilus outer membrane usher protein, partial [Providencia rettgeri]